MTFVSETVRILFHQLPTETQMQYVKLSERFSERGAALCIEAVCRHERILEVVVRVGEYLETRNLPSHNITKTNLA
jgi:hypothetical protein